MSNVSAAVVTDRRDDGEIRFRWEALPLPPLTPFALRVSVQAVGVNPVDAKLSRSREGDRVHGFDAVGTVAAVGSGVTRFRVGDVVWYAGTTEAPGAFQTLHTVDSRLVAKAPSSLSAADAAALPLTMLTAWEALHHKLRLDRSSRGTLLVVGAAGGAGSAIVQLARALAPEVRVIGTASREESADWVRSLGAHEVVDARTDLVDTVRRLAPDGVDAIVSAWSQGRVAEYARVLSPFGNVVGLDRGPIDVTPLKPLSASWHWVYMFTRADPKRCGDAHGAMLEEIRRRVDAGQLVSTRRGAPGRLSPQGLRSAYRTMEAGTAIGKIVLAVS